jgi:hypothetical protein
MSLMSRRLPLVALAIMLGALVGLGARAVINQSPTDEDKGDAPRINAFASWKFHFDTSAEMLATADYVVEGDVSGVSRGRILPGDSEVKQQLKEFRILPTRIWKGTIAHDPLIVEDAGWEISTAPGEGEMELVIADTIQPTPGDHGLFYLRKNRSNGRLSFINNQGLFLVSGDKIKDTSRSDPLVDDIERLTVSSLRLQLQRDQLLVKAGAVLPKRPR